MSHLPQSVLPIPRFANVSEAKGWALDKVDDPCVDNFRFAYLDNAQQMRIYEGVQDRGCCGFFDRQVYVGDRLAMVGCNYGH